MLKVKVNMEAAVYNKILTATTYLSGYSVAQIRRPHCKHFIGVLFAQLIKQNFIFTHV